MRKPVTLFVLLRAAAWAIGGLAFGLYGVWVAAIERDLPRATFFLVVALNFDASYFQLAYHYDLRFKREAPDAGA